MSEMAGPTPQSDARRKKQRARNIALLCALLGFVVVIYLVSVLRMGGG